MAVNAIDNDIIYVSGIKYTHTTDDSSDWDSVSNDTYFYDLDTKLPYYKNGDGDVLYVFQDSSSGSSIYTDDGTLSGDRIVDLNGNDLDFKDGDLSASLTSYIGTSNPKGKFFSIPTNREGYLDGSLWFRNLNNSTGTITPHHRFYSGGLPSYVGASGQQFLFGKTNNDSGAKFEMLAQYSGMFIHNNAPVTKSFLGLLHLYPDTGNGTVALNVENPVGSIIMARANSNREVILRGTNVIGSETISLQGSTLIKGEGTSTGTTLALYDNDTTPNKTWEWLDNGNVVVGQNVNFVGDSSSVGSLKLYRPANPTNYGAGFDIDLNNSANIQTNYGRFGAQIVTNTSGSEYGKSYVAATKNGVVKVISEFDSVDGLTIKPVTTSNLLKAGDVFTVSTNDVTVKDISGSGTALQIYRENGGVGAGVGFNIDLNNSSNSQTTYGRIVSIIESNTIGSETGRLELRVADSGTVTTKVKIKSNTTNIVMPTSNSGLSAGDLWEDNGVVRIGTSTSSIGGSSIYTDDGTLSGDRVITMDNSTFSFSSTSGYPIIKNTVTASTSGQKILEIKANHLGAVTGCGGYIDFSSANGDYNVGRIHNYQFGSFNAGFRIFSLATDGTANLGSSYLGQDGYAALIGENVISRVSTEKVSLQGFTLIKGEGTSTGTTLALYDNDTTPNKTWEWLDNGNVNINQATTFDFNNQFTTFDDIPVFDINAKAEPAFVMRITAGNNSISNGARIELYETSAYNGYAKSLIFKARKTEGDIKHIAYSNSTHGFYLTSGYNASDDFNNSIVNSNRRFEIGDNLTFFQNTDLIVAPNVTTGTPALIGGEDISLQGDVLMNANVNMSNLPTSNSGLSAGDLWDDNGSVRIGTSASNGGSGTKVLVKGAMGANQTADNTIPVVEFVTTGTPTGGAFDINSEWDNTNHKFTVGASGAGTYFVQAQIFLTNGTGWSTLYLYKNGSIYSSFGGNGTDTTNTWDNLDGTIAIDLVVGDYIDIRAFSSVNGTISFSQWPTRQSFSITKVSAVAPAAGTDVNALHTNISNEINSVTEKTDPSNTDKVLIEESDGTKKSQSRKNFKRLVVSTTTTSSSLTPSIDDEEAYVLTALSDNLTINAPTGTPYDFQTLWFRITDNGVSRTISTNALFVDYTGNFPTSTTPNKQLIFASQWDGSNWNILAWKTQP